MKTPTTKFKFLVGKDEFEVVALNKLIAGFVMIREFGFVLPITPVEDEEPVIYPKSEKDLHKYLSMEPRHFAYLYSEAIQDSYKSIRQIYK